MGRRNLNRSNIAEILHLSRFAVARRLRAEVDFSATELATLAELFGVPIGELYGEDAA